MVSNNTTDLYSKTLANIKLSHNGLPRQYNYIKNKMWRRTEVNSWLGYVVSQV